MAVDVELAELTRTVNRLTAAIEAGFADVSDAITEVDVTLGLINEKIPEDLADDEEDEQREEATG